MVGIKTPGRAALHERSPGLPIQSPTSLDAVRLNLVSLALETLGKL